MWTTFGASAAGIGAGLTSLAFLVVAFRYDPIATSDEYRNRAGQVLCTFVATTLSATLTLVPQHEVALGAEFAVVAAVSAVVLLRFDAAARRASRVRGNPVAMIGFGAFVAALAAAAILLLTAHDAGLFAFAAAFAIALVSGVVGAWTFLTRAGSPRRADISR